MTASLFPSSSAHSRGAVLRNQLQQADGVVAAPGCFDGMSARLLDQAGFEAAFLGGFSVAASRLGLPDVGLLSYGEMVDQLRDVTAATARPVIADADTGYGNPMNAARSFLGYAAAGAACVMIEDQEWPKRCGHTAGKQVVPLADAVARVRACAAARDHHGLDVLIMARTDAVATDGFDEAMRRVDAFVEAGADLTFLEAPETERQMATYCAEIGGMKTANLVEDGKTPWLGQAELGELGYSVVLYPVTLLLHGMRAMAGAADELRSGVIPDPSRRASFDEARSAVGWPDYDQQLGDIESAGLESGGIELGSIESGGDAEV